MLKPWNLGHANILMSAAQGYHQLRETYVLLFRYRPRPRRRRRKLLLSFCGRSFSQKLQGLARAMKLGSCIHLDEHSSKLPSILSLDLHFMVHLLCKFLSSFFV